MRNLLGVLLLAAAPLGAMAEPKVEQTGKASYYHDRFEGQKTASGERFDNDEMTAASKELPLGARATVTNPANGREVEVKVNDRGPYVEGRVIDLSREAAERLDIKEQGVAEVKVEARRSQQPTPRLKDKIGEMAGAR